MSIAELYFSLTVINAYAANRFDFVFGTIQRCCMRPDYIKPYTASVGLTVSSGYRLDFRLYFYDGKNLQLYCAKAVQLQEHNYCSAIAVNSRIRDIFPNAGTHPFKSALAGSCEQIR